MTLLPILTALVIASPEGARRSIHGLLRLRLAMTIKNEKALKSTNLSASSIFITFPFSLKLPTTLSFIGRSNTSGFYLLPSGTVGTFSPFARLLNFEVKSNFIIFSPLLQELNHSFFLIIVNFVMAYFIAITKAARQPKKRPPFLGVLKNLLCQGNGLFYLLVKRW